MMMLSRRSFGLLRAPILSMFRAIKRDSMARAAFGRCLFFPSWEILRKIDKLPKHTQFLIAFAPLRFPPASSRVRSGNLRIPFLPHFTLYWVPRRWPTMA